MMAVGPTALALPDLVPVLPMLPVLALLMVPLAIGYLVGGRVTLSIRQFAQALMFGAVGATVLAYLLERMASRVVGVGALPYTAAPIIEELAKALPLVVIVGFRPDWRKLTAVDLAIIGLATGVGFEFVETTLRVIVHGSLNAGGVLSASPWLLGWRTAGDGAINAAGHAVWTGVVGLLTGLGLAVWRHRAAGIVAGLLALAWVVFDHAAFNWELAQTVPLHGAAQLPSAQAFLYGLTLHGRLELIVLPLGLLLANILESYRALKVVEPEFALGPESIAPGLVPEIVAVVAAISRGPRAPSATRTYQRLRRAYAAATSAARRSDDGMIAAHAEYLRHQLRQRRRALPQATPWAVAQLPPLPSIGRRLLSLLRARAVPLAFLALAVLYLNFPHGLPGWLGRPLLSAPVLLAGAVVGLAYGARRLIDLRRRPGPNARSATSERAVEWDMRVLLAVGATSVSRLALVGWFLPQQVWAPLAGAFIADAVGEFALCGGVPPPLAPGAGPDKTWLAIRLVDDNGDPIPYEAYELTSEAGSVSGLLDADGYAREDGLEEGDWQVGFPEIDASEWHPGEPEGDIGSPG